MADKQARMPVLYSCDDFVIADKEHNVPTVPLKGQRMEGTLLGLVSALFPDVLGVSGRNAWEFGAMHRLDTATGGLVVFARNQGFYDWLLDAQARGLFKKTYSATCLQDGRLKGLEMDLEKGAEATVSSYFRSYGPGGKQVRPTSDIRRADSDVLYSTSVKLLETREDCAVFRCRITRGFRHQIRAHLAWIGYPIRGDILYGSGEEGQILELECNGVDFPLEGGKVFSFSV